VRRLGRWLGFAGPGLVGGDGVGGVAPGPAEARPVGGSAGEPVREADSFAQTIIDEDRGWRSLISGGMRELTWAQIIDNLNTMLVHYRENPLAFRLVQLAVDHVLGDGMSLRSDDPAVQAELDLWWNHPLNNLAVRQFELLTALSLDGEIFVSEHVNPFDQTSYIRLVPAGLIDRIETNPDDLEDELRYHQTAQPMTPDTLMRLPSALQAEGRWWDRSEMRHFAINRPAGVVRGQSDLAPLLPWFRRYRDWLTDRVRLNKYRTAFLWHVQLKGADRRALIQRQAELAQPPNPGSIIVSNENETWTAVQPQIHASDVEADGLAIRLMIAAGAGVPLFWLAEAEHTARGTAGEMAEPTYRHFRQRQLYFGWAMRSLAVDALRRRGLVQVDIGDLVAEFPELDPSTSLSVAQAMAQITESLATAVAQGWLTPADAARIYQHFVGEAVSLPGDDAAGARGTGERGRQKVAGKPGVGPAPRRAGPGGLVRPVLDPSDPRAQEPVPPPWNGSGVVVPEPITHI
jgi:hypothetical protein